MDTKYWVLLTLAMMLRSCPLGPYQFQVLLISIKFYYSLVAHQPFSSIHLISRNWWNYSMLQTFSNVPLPRFILAWNCRPSLWCFSGYYWTCRIVVDLLRIHISSMLDLCICVPYHCILGFLSWYRWIHVSRFTYGSYLASIQLY